MLAQHPGQPVPRDIEQRFIREVAGIARWALENLKPTFDKFPSIANEESTRDASEIAYLAHRRIEQSFINLLLVQIYHQWEQQLALITMDMDRARKFSYSSSDELAEGVKKQFGLVIAAMDSWPPIGVLRLASNVVKHSASTSSDRLKALREKWFEPPENDFLRSLDEDPWYPPELAAVGQDFFPTWQDFQNSASALSAFWNEFGAIKRGECPNPGTVKDWIFKRRNSILALCQKHGVGSVRLFGSVARGEAGPASDVDFLVTPPAHQEGWLPPTVKLKKELELLLDRNVDVVSDRSKNKALLERALKDAIPL